MTCIAVMRDTRLAKPPYIPMAYRNVAQKIRLSNLHYIGMACVVMVYVVMARDIGLVENPYVGMAYVLGVVVMARDND